MEYDIKRQQVKSIQRARVKARAKSATTRYPRTNPQQLRDALENPFGTKQRRRPLTAQPSVRRVAQPRPATARAIVAKVSNVYAEDQMSRYKQKLEATRRKAKRLEHQDWQQKATSVQAVRDRRHAFGAQRAVHAAQSKFPTRLFSALQRRYSDTSSYQLVDEDRAESAGLMLIEECPRVFSKVSLARGVPPAISSLQSG